MINLYSGTPGSGKSFHAVALILRFLGKKRYVVANFPMIFTVNQKKKGFEERFFYMPNEMITIESLLEFAIDMGFFDKGKESQCLVVIDEAGGRFNCRDFKNSDRAEWIDFFSQHRKVGYDFVLVAQNDRMLDRQIRGYIESEIKHRKVNNFGPFNFLPIPCFVAIEHWYTAKLRVGSEFMFFRKKIAAQYDSMKMFSGFKLSKHLLEKIEAKKQKKELETPEGMTVPITAIFTEDAE